jgi:hypothetical protein
MPSTPREWLDHLVARLDARWFGELQVYDAYYMGDHQLAFATRKFRDAYGHLFQTLTDNWMPIVVDSSVERLRVQGFRFGKNQQADEDAWDIWQANGLDGESNMVHTEAVKLGWAYWMVQPNGEVPRITAEHPSQVIVQCSPGDRRTRLAALKKWVDGEFIYANVYLPDRVVKYRTTARTLQIEKGEKRWQTVGATRNPLGVVPIIPVPNNPSMLHGGRSDLAGGAIRVQDAINKLLADMLIGSEYQAYPQRVLLGVTPPTYPVGHDLAGQVIPNADLKASQSHLWFFPDKDSKAFQFDAADLDNFRKAIDGLVRDLTAQTRTPPHYVAGQIVNASGDALKAAETGLVSKVRDKMDPFGEAHEEAMRLAFLSIDRGDPRAQATDAEVIWRDPESRSQAETVDAAVKLASIGVPQEMLWERIGMSPQEIDRAKQLQEADALLGALNAVEPAVPAPNGAVPPAAAPVPQQG